MTEETALNQVYLIFKKTLSFKDFQEKVNHIQIDKWTFVRGVYLYQQAIKCKECNPNVSMTILVSCADSFHLVGKRQSLANFKEFYLRYCPIDFRKPPIEIYPNGELPKADASFDKALNYIYQQFRCMYIHEGVGVLENNIDASICFHTFIDKIPNEPDLYSTDMKQILDWFTKITFESLLALLIKPGNGKT